jgi:two-component system cell cycle response regulator DivK
VSDARRTAARILVVEDDPDNRRIVVKVLAVDGYTTLEAADGESAVALARREHPDAILMDLAMPGVDGWEAARRLKADPATADIPIVALTAFALRGDEDRAREAGCDAYLAKPCRPQAIRDVVGRLLQRRP